MEFIDKYKTTEMVYPTQYDVEGKPLPAKQDLRKVISDDAFAIGDIIADLIKKIERVRTDLM